MKWVGLLLLICAGFFWKLVFTNQYTWLDSPDYAYQVLPWYQFQAGEWHAKNMPLWDPNLWGGQPLIGQVITGAAYPPNWLLFLLPLRKGWIRQPYLHWYFVLIHFQAALFCYWLCRDLKRSRGASLLAGLAFALGGYIGTTGWPQMLNGAVWAPLVLLFFLRAMRGERPFSSAAWSGVFLGISFLSGHHQIPIFLCVAMAGAWLYYVALDRSRVKLLLVFGMFLALAAAFQALPAYEYGKLSLRWAGTPNPLHWNERIPYYVHQQFSLPPVAVLGIVVPGIFVNTDPFIGLVVISLALLGLAGSWNDRTARFFAAFALGGLLFAFGPASIFHGVLYALAPMVEKARSDAMAIFLFHFGAAVLVAYGIDSFDTASDGAKRWAARLLVGISTAVGSAALVLLLMKKPGDDRLGIVVLVGFALAAVFSAWRLGRITARAATVSLTLLMLLELGNVTTYSMGSQVDRKTLIKQLADHGDIAQFLSARSREQPVRAEIDETDIPYNFGDWYGIDHFGGYMASITENVTRVQANTRARMMYAVNYQVSRKKIRPDQVEVFTSASGVKVYGNPEAFPRAWIVHEAFSISGDDQIGAYLGTPSFDARRQVFVKAKAPELQNCGEQEYVSLVERRADRVDFEARLGCRGMVIDSDTYFPGWTATVDGKPAQVFEAYGFLRGVVVDAGQHRIQLRYRPKSVYWGAALTGLGLLGAVVLQVTVRKR